MNSEKRTYSGPLLECDIYPSFTDGRRIPARAPKSKPSSAAQARYNRLMTGKRLVRLVNANFDGTDYYMHPTYSPQNAPSDEREARNNIRNYIRRVKTRRQSELKKAEKLLSDAQSTLAAAPDNMFLALTVEKLRERTEKLKQPLRYVYTIEQETYKKGRYAGKSNWHYHMFISGGLSEREMEQIWSGGVRVNCNRYKPESFGPEAAAVYMGKDPRGYKRFVCSRNLRQPKERTRPGKLTERTVERMAQQRVDDRAYWERRYRGYRFVRCYSRLNPYNHRWYVSVIMYRTDGDPPEWRVDDWITTDGP